MKNSVFVLKFIFLLSSYYSSSSGSSRTLTRPLRTLLSIFLEISVAIWYFAKLIRYFLSLDQIFYTCVEQSRAKTGDVLCASWCSDVESLTHILRVQLFNHAESPAIWSLLATKNSFQRYKCWQVNTALLLLKEEVLSLMQGSEMNPAQDFSLTFFIK